MDKTLLTLKKITVTAEGKEILHEVDWQWYAGETKVLLGPNGAGKSTLAGVIAGLPQYSLVNGEICWEGQPINEKSLDERARAGIFLTWQEPVAIPGVSVSNFLREASEKVTGQQQTIFAWQTKLNKFCEQLQLSPTVLSREIGVGFSGGEKKKLELLQMLALRPKMVILDEIDSGLDTDAARVAREVITNYQRESGAALLIITHTGEIIRGLSIDQVGVLRRGRLQIYDDEQILAQVRRDGFASLEEDKHEWSDA